MNFDRGHLIENRIQAQGIDSTLFSGHLLFPAWLGSVLHVGMIDSSD